MRRSFVDNLLEHIEIGHILTELVGFSSPVVIARPSAHQLVQARFPSQPNPARFGVLAMSDLKSEQASLSEFTENLTIDCFIAAGGSRMREDWDPPPPSG